MYCSNCGKEIAEGTRFCPHCGSATAQAEATEKAGAQSGGTAAKGNRAAVIKEKIAGAMGAGFGIMAGLLVLFIPLALIFGAIPAFIIVAAGTVYEAWHRFGGRHPVRLAIAIAVVFAQVLFLHQANHNAQSVQAVKECAARGDGMTWGTFAQSMLGSPAWSIEGAPKDGVYRVRLTGKLMDTQTGKKLKTKVHFLVGDVWNVNGGTAVEVDSVYIKTLGQGSDAMQAFNALLYSMD